MRTKINILAICSIIMVLVMVSCDTIKDKLFVAFTTNSADMAFTINVITTTDSAMEFGSFGTTMNIDSVIKAQSGGSFGLKDIKSINMEECKLTILNADTTNNFANFEEGWLNFSTNVNTTPVKVASGLNPDVFATIWLMPVDKTINMKDYFSGNQFSYILSGKARRVTTKKLDINAALKFTIN